MTAFFFAADLTLLYQVTSLGSRWASACGRSLPTLALSAGLGIASLATGARAQEGARSRPPSDPLGHVAAEAVANNLSLAGDRLLEEQAAAELDAARGRYLPTLSISSRYSEQSGAVDLGDLVNPVNGALNQITGTRQFPTDLSVTLPYKHESRIRLTQTLFNERALAGWSAAGHAYESQRAQRRARARAVAADAQTAFLRVAAARSATMIWEETLPLVAEAERVAARLVAAGSATPDAVFRAKAERSDVEQKLDDAREAERSAARAFNRLMHRSLDAPVDSIDEASLLFPLALTEDEAVESALSRREELSAFDEGVSSLSAGVRAATAGYLPEVAVALDYGFQGGDLSFGPASDFWTASLVLSWNLFDGGQTSARRRAAVAARDGLRIRREDTEDLIRLEVRQAHQAAVVAREAISTAQDRSSAADRTFVLVRRRYEEGLASQIEFLDARTTLTNAELNRVITIYRYAMAWVELERAAALRDISEWGAP